MESGVKRLWFVVLVTSLGAGTVLAQGKETERLAHSAKVFGEIMAAPDKGIPGDLLDKADCVAIIPSMKKAGFIFGGRYGKGMISCRNKAQTAWGPPAMVILEGGSFGLQIGGAAVDVVLLVMNRTGVDSLLSSKVTLGGDASVAGGPVGRATTAETDAAMRAKILTYSRSQGVFAGLELKGSTLRSDKDANKALYSRQIEAREILTPGKVGVPAAAHPVIKVLTRYSPKGK
jgi:SH3 domain-containing YSC84-like protein 1